MARQPIRWRMHINVRPERVFDALDTAEGRRSFWAESAVEVDGRIEFRFISGVTHSARVLERRRPYLWSIEYFGGKATFALSDADGGTDLLLTHENVPDEHWMETYAGWLNVLFTLKAWVTHGIDLRNHDPTRTWDHGYADQ